MAGEHLDALVGDANKALEMLPTIIKDAKRVNPLSGMDVQQPIDNGAYIALAYPSTEASFLVMIEINNAKEANEVVAFYPFLRAGIPHELEILDIRPDPDCTEGSIEAVNRNAVTISFYDPTFACNKHIYANGCKYSFSIAALAYVLEKVEDTNIRITKGAALEMLRQRQLEDDPNADVSKVTHVDISTANLRFMFPHDNDVDAEFQTVVEGVEYIDMVGTRICKMPVVLMRPDDEDFRVILYASEHVLKGYKPQVGDSIRGVLWLQGYPLRTVEDPANWGDRLTDSSPQHSMEGIARSFNTTAELRHLHPGIVALASSCATVGWDVIPFENPDRSSPLPAFQLDRTGRKPVNVWIRTHIVGQESPVPFSPEEIANNRAACENHDQEAAFVTMVCTDVGSGYTFKAQGIDTLEKHIGKFATLEYMAKSQFSKEGDQDSQQDED